MAWHAAGGSLATTISHTLSARGPHAATVTAALTSHHARSSAATRRGVSRTPPETSHTSATSRLHYKRFHSPPILLKHLYMSFTFLRRHDLDFPAPHSCHPVGRNTPAELYTQTSRSSYIHLLFYIPHVKLLLLFFRLHLTHGTLILIPSSHLILLFTSPP